MNRSWRTRAALIVLSCCCVASLASPSQHVEGLVNLRFQLDVRIFAVMAALNAAGFDLDADALEQNPARKLVRERLAAAPEELRSTLRDFYRTAASGLTPQTAQSKFVSLALLLNGPPGFELPFKPEELPEDARAVIGFEALISQLWRDADLAQLWRRVNPYYVSEAETYRPHLRDIIVTTLRYMRTEARIALDREVAFIPDLLNGYGVVNARNIGSIYIVVVGPSRTGEKPVRSLRHEYLHFLLDPLIEKHRAALPPADPFLARVREQPSSLQRYRDDFMLMLTESLIRTTELRMAGARGGDLRAGLVRLYDEGLILSPYFSECLEEFEKTSQALQEFFPELMSGIAWNKENRRAAEMEPWRKSVSTSPPAVDGPKAPARTEITELLAEANRLLLARQFESAAPLLQKALALEPSNASALFGLGQVGARAQDYEGALQSYARAAANAKPGEDWIAAWSYVRRGNIFLFLNEPDKARAEWERVIHMVGDLRGAREAAAKGLAEQ